MYTPAGVTFEVTRKLEKYELLDELGHGGMATVYRARDTRLDRMVALKVLHPHLRAAPQARTRFTREARSVARLKHPNILEIYDYSGEDSDESYIAAELLTGPTLEGLIEGGPPLPAEIAACIGVQVGRALSAAHASGIIHRDVKPGNVLVHDQRLVKLTDFGIAQMVDSQSFTATGQILGSPGHMAPEQIEGDSIDARTDVFALGTVLYFLAAGRLPFVGRNPHQVLKRIVDGEYADPLRVNPRIGATLAQIIRCALSTDPADRYPTAAALCEALEAFVAEIGIEDVDQALATYLKDPAPEAERLEKVTIEQLSARGEKLAEQGDLAGALARFDRVLALDDGNEAVLRIVERLGRRRRLSELLPRVALAGLVLLGIACLAWVYLTPVQGPRASRLDAGTPDAGASILTSVDAASPDAASHIDSSTLAQDVDAGTQLRPAQLTQHVPNLPRTPRAVIFDPSPQRVRISVDDAPPRPYGPGFQRVDLRPGPHRFVFQAEGTCCETATFTVNIPPGHTPFRLERTLAFNPARVLVRSSVPGVVHFSAGRGGVASGPTDEIFSVPMGQLDERRQFTVTAEGRPVYTGSLQLTAGSLAPAVRVQLGPAGGD